MRALWPYFCLLLLPILLAGGFIGMYGANLPFMDQYGFCWRLMYLDTHPHEWWLFWTPHNEHRLFLPQLIMWALASLTHWNIRVEMAAGFLCSLAGFCILCYRRFQKTPVLCVLISCLWFSLTQWENWLWGWQIQTFLMQAAAVFCCYRLSRPFSWRHFHFALAGALVSSFSYGSGLVLWPLALPVFFLLYRNHPKQRQDILRAALLWCVAMLLVIYCYAGSDLSKSPAPSNLLLWAEYFFAFLGAPLAAQHLSIAIAVGITGVLLFALLSLRLYRLKKPDEALKLFWLIAAFAIGNGAAIGLSRAGFGVEQALSSRYVSISTLLWVGLLGACWNWKPLWTKRAFVPLLLVGFLFSSQLGYREGAAHAAQMQQVETYLLHHTTWDTNALAYLHPRPYFRIHMLEWLKKNQMALFHESR